MTNSYQNLRKLFIESVLKDLKEESWLEEEAEKWDMLCLDKSQKHKFLSIRTVNENKEADMPYPYFFKIEDNSENRQRLSIPLDSENGFSMWGIDGGWEYYTGYSDQSSEGNVTGNSADQDGFYTIDKFGRRIWNH